MKAVAKYPGSKWSLAKWITSYFPEHHSYLEHGMNKYYEMFWIK